jgi:hypothetical protein
MRSRRSGRREIRPRSDQDKQARLPDTVRYARQHFERGGVDPVCILYDQEHRPSFTQTNNLVDQERYRSGFKFAGRCHSRCQMETYSSNLGPEVQLTLLNSLVGPGGVPAFSNFNGLVCPTGSKSLIEGKGELFRLSNRRSTPADS